MSTLEHVRDSLRYCLKLASDALESLQSNDTETAYDLINRLICELEHALNLLSEIL